VKLEQPDIVDRMISGLRLGVRALLAFVFVSANASAASAALTCDKIPQLAGHFLRKHVAHRTLNEELVRRTAEAYLDKMDPSKTLLLRPEADAIVSSFGEVFEGASSGECQPLVTIHTRIVERYEELETKARTIVSAEDFAIDPETQLIIDPQERGRPETIEERDDLLRRQIDFQLANYVSAGTSLEESKERLVHRYELFTLRAREFDLDDLYTNFLDAFASSLDPHSNYLSAEALEDFQIAMTLSLEGIGVALSSRDGYSIVERVLPGGAADREASLRTGDRIIGVAQEEGPSVDIIDMALRDVVRLIRGRRDTPVTLTVLREGETTERFQVTIVRDTIDLEEQAAGLRFETLPVGPVTQDEDGNEIAGRSYKLAVLELSSFYGDRDPSKRQCADDVARLLEQVKSENADGLVLDLSRNGGGLLDYAVEISGFFIRTGGIVAVRERSGGAEVHEDPNGDVLYAGPLVVLTSRASASASEILAGALQDYGRAVIVGDDHTYGKGTVQTVQQLGPDLGALKVTTAMFYRPGGASTQRSGVTADIRIPSLLNTDRFGEASQPYALEPQRIQAFATEAARSKDDDGRWRPVSAKMLALLAADSQSRVEESSEFQAIVGELAKAEERGGTMRVAEILGEQNVATTSEEEAPTVGAVEGQLASAPSPAPADPDKKDDEDKPTPQVVEALRILADLIRLQEPSDG
jgi:carboxyl-terminal processing protease